MRSTQVQEPVRRDAARPRPAGQRGAARPGAPAPAPHARRPGGNGGPRGVPASPAGRGRRPGPADVPAVGRWSTGDLRPGRDASVGLRPVPGAAARGLLDRRPCTVPVVPLPGPSQLQEARRCESVQVAPPSQPVPSDRRHAVPRVRLTRRGRLAVTTLVGTSLLTVLAAVSAALAGPSTTGPVGVTGAAARPVAVTVSPGDTLWSLAERTAPGRDPRATVADIRALNQLPGPLQAGQQLLVPIAE